MEIKTQALLLSLLVIIGVTTMDAYAQSNTDRIASIDDNISAIQVVLDTINTMVSSIFDAVNELDTNIMEVNSTISSVNASVTNIQSNVTTISLDVGEIKAIIPSVNNIDETLTQIENKMNSLEATNGNPFVIQTIAEKLNNLEQRMSGLSDKMDIIDTKLSQLFGNDTIIQSFISNDEGEFIDTKYRATFNAFPANEPMGGTTPYENYLTCNGDPFVITSIDGQVSRDVLYPEDTVRITVLDEGRSSTAIHNTNPDVMYSFGGLSRQEYVNLGRYDDGSGRLAWVESLYTGSEFIGVRHIGYVDEVVWTLEESVSSSNSLPLRVDGHDVKISGTSTKGFPGGMTVTYLLIEIEFYSTADAECIVQTWREWRGID